MSTFTKLRHVVAVRNFLSISQPSCKNFHVSSVSRLKEICREETKDGVTVIRGEFVKSPRENYLLKLPKKENSEACHECPICRLGPTIHVRHTDVLILHQFVSSDGRILPRAVTGLCRYQNKRMNYLIVMSRHAGLLPKYLPDGTIDPHESEGWKANNKYYSEEAMDDFFTTERRKL